MVGNPGKAKPQLGLALHRPCGVARQHVDRPGLELVEPLGCIERHELDKRSITEGRGGNRLAEVDVEASPLSLGRLRCKTLKPWIDPAQQLAARLHLIQRRSAGERQGGQQEQQTSKQTRHGSNPDCAPQARPMLARCQAQ
jgi:hypothetical protein